MSDQQPLAGLPFPHLSLTWRLRLSTAVRAFLYDGYDGTGPAWANPRRAGRWPRAWPGWPGVASLRARVALLAMSITTSSSPMSTGGASGDVASGADGAGEWVALLLAVICTLVIVALFLTPTWLPGWRRWQAVHRRRRNARSSTAIQAAQRFAEAVARGDFEVAETEAEHILNP
jgi:hypothetical protein